MSKTARWVKYDGTPFNNGFCEKDEMFCSNCRYHTRPQIAKWEDINGVKWMKYIPRYKCPNCWADMEVDA